MKLFRAAGLWAAIFVVLVPLPVVAQDQGQFGRVIRIDRKAFQPNAGLIQFSEVALQSRNPVYRPNIYGAPPNGVTVTFAGFFEGQGIALPGQCPHGAIRQGCINGTPLAPLRLSSRAPLTFTVRDTANPRSPSLSGSPTFNGPISMLFDKDVAGVGMMGGFFDAYRGTAIQAFDRNGNLIGGVKNIAKGMEYLALVTEDGRDRIAGVQFSLVGPEPAGYGIDDLSFAFSTQIDRGQVPGLADAAPATPRKDNAGGGGSLSDLFKDTGKAEKEPAPKAGGAEGGSLTDLFKSN